MDNNFSMHRSLRDRSFRCLLATTSLTALGGMVGQTAMSWWILQAGSTADLATYSSFIAFASTVALPLLAPIGDRYPKRILMSIGLALLCIECLLLGITAQSSEYKLSIVLVLGLLSVVANAFVLPATDTIASEILPPADLARGLELLRASMSIGRVAGPLVAGALLAMVNIHSGLWVSAGVMAVAFGAVLGVRNTVETCPSTAQSWANAVKTGMLAKWRIPLERWLTGLSFASLLFILPGIGLLIPLKAVSDNLSPVWLGSFEAAFSAGFIFGSLRFSRWMVQRVGSFWANWIAFGTVGGGFLAVGLVSVPALVAAILFLIGCAIVTIQLTGQSARILATPSHFRARFAASHLLFVQSAATGGPAFAGMLVAQFQVGGAYVVLGAALLGICSALYFLPGYRDFVGRKPEELSDYYFKRWPEAFD